MEDEEFFRLLHLFPVVRSRNYCEDQNPSASSPNSVASQEKSVPKDQSVYQSLAPVKCEGSSKDPSVSSQENGKPDRQKTEDVFWLHLKETIEQKLGPEDSRSFCDNFRLVHENLVRTIPLESIKKIGRNMESFMKQQIIQKDAGCHDFNPP